MQMVFIIMMTYFGTKLIELRKIMKTFKHNCKVLIYVIHILRVNGPYP